MKLSVSRIRETGLLNQKDASWQEILNTLSTHLQIDDKKEAIQFGAVEFQDLEKKSYDSALRVHFGVLDLDDVSKDQFDKVRGKLGLYSFHIYTTYSHSRLKEEQGQYRVRVVFPFNRAVEKHEWDTFSDKLWHYFDRIPDEGALKDITRLYLVPSGFDLADHWTKTSSGLVFDVDRFLKEEKVEIRKSISRQEIANLAASLKRRKDEFCKLQGSRLDKVLKGHSFAEHGERQVALYELCKTLVHSWPEIDPEDCEALFRPSFQLMQMEGSRNANKENLFKILEQVKRNKQEEIEAEEKEKVELQANLIKVAFGGSRNHPYTQEELQGFAESQGVTQEDFKNYWVIQKESSYFIFFDGSYVHVSEKGLALALDQFLSPAITAGVITEKKTPAEIIKEHGQVALELIMDMTIQRSYFDRATKTLYEATCPLRVKESLFDPEVDQYLGFLAGDDKDKLLDWLSVVTRQDRSCTALYLRSPPGFGKSTFFNGLARLWTTGTATTLGRALKEFNAKIANCPLVVADEVMPKEFRDDLGTGAIREFIAATQRDVVRKFKEPATLRGAARLILCANNMDMLKTREHLSKDDIDALIERYIIIDCTDARAKTLLISMGRDRADSFIYEDRLAKHVLWLRDNHKIEEPGRFMVQGRISKLQTAANISEGVPSAIINWMVSYLQNPNLVDMLKTGLVRIHNKELLINTKALCDYWDKYTTNIKPPTPAMISKAMGRLTSINRVLRWKSKSTKYWVVDTEKLLIWADEHNYCTEQEIMVALSRDTPEEPENRVLFEKLGARNETNIL